MIDIRYKIISDYSLLVLHNITTGSRITNPVNYYNSLADRYYGASKITYMSLASQISGHHAQMLKAMQSILSGGTNTMNGIFVDASTLNS